MVLREKTEKQTVASTSAINELINIRILYAIKIFLSHLKHINVVIKINNNALNVFSIGISIK